jgi:hypothetical protein
MRTIAYVDGFNLYFGALRKAAHRWLNLQRLMELHLMAHNQLIGINYKHLRPNFVAAAQFPDTLADARGTFTKPAAWF